MISKRIFIVICCYFLQGCFSDSECELMSEVKENPQLRLKLLEWADSRIFSRSFKEKNLNRPGIGPQPSPGDIKSSLSENLVPKFLEGYKIRLIGKSVSEFNMIFLKTSKFHGLLISRADFESDLSNTSVKMAQLKSRDDRVGLLCIRAFE